MAADAIKKAEELEVLLHTTLDQFPEIKEALTGDLVDQMRRTTKENRTLRQEVLALTQEVRALRAEVQALRMAQLRR
jgi:uncharacterized protein YlxW (UPF0749 family)